MASGLESWRVGAGSPKPTTHLLLDGGKLHVPPDQDSLFLNKLAVRIVQGSPDHVVEVRTPLFKLFWDVDAHLDASSVLQDEAWEALLGRLVALTQAFFGPGVDSDCLVCRTPPRALADGGVIKHGFHLHFPGLVTSPGVALGIRKVVLPSLSEGETPLANGWDKALDAAVFGGSGLRLPYQRKGKHAAPDAVYAPAFWLRQDGAMQRVEKLSTVSAIREVLKVCSIRAGQDATPTPLREDVLAMPEMAEAAEADETGALCKQALGARHRSLAAYVEVLPMLSDALPIFFAGERFTAVMETDNCFILRSSSRYCCNLGRSHSTNNVYFVLKPAGIAQHCYCRCDTILGRRSGKPCRDFCSAVWEVPPEVTRFFFQNKMLDDKLLLDHPVHGLEAGKLAAAKQEVYDVRRQRRRLMPSTIAAKRNTVACWFKKPVK